MSRPATSNQTTPIQAPANRARPFQTISQLVSGLWAAVAKPAGPSGLPADTVVVHDPAAARPHNLDDPFFDPRAQIRMAKVIAEAAQKR